MRAWNWIFGVAAILAVLGGSSGTWAVRGASPVAVEVADLKEQLEDGLKVRLPREFKFVDTVVQLVEDNKLPLPLVKGTFHWARKKAGDKKYPFPYFERALRIRAKRIGVTIP